MSTLDRRELLKLGGAALAAGAVAGPAHAADAQPGGAAALSAPPIDTVRIGFVGIGGQGSGHVRNLLRIPGRLIKCLRQGQPTDMNVYDAAALSAVIDASVRSVRKKAAPVDIPDFTRGRWKTLPPLPIVHM
jgi:hypothetical protein